MKLIFILISLVMAAGVANAGGRTDSTFNVVIEYRFQAQADPEDPRRFVMMMKSSTIKVDWNLQFYLDNVEWPDLRVQDGVNNTVEDKSLALILRPNAKTGEKQLLVIVDPFGQNDRRYLTPIYDWDASTQKLKSMAILDYEIADVAGWFTNDMVVNLSMGQVSSILKEMFGEEKYLEAKWRANYSPLGSQPYICSQEKEEVSCRFESFFQATAYSSLVDKEYFEGAKKPGQLDALTLKKNIQSLVKIR